MPDLRVLYVPTSNAGVGYYRLWSWAVAAHRNRAFHALAPWYQKGMHETHPWEEDINTAQYHARIMNELWDHVQKADVVIFQMVHTPAALNVFLSVKEARPDIPVLAEIDDNMMSTPEYNPASAFYQPGSVFREVAVSQFRAADAMIVSTPYLKEVYSDLNPNIHVVENSIDFSLWDGLKKDRKHKIRIGWAGGASHDEDLRIIEPTVMRCLEKSNDIEFCFVHGVPSFFKDIPRVIGIKQFTRIDKYPAFLSRRGFDIGLAPLVDSAFNRAKSNLRWLEYSAMRVPTVASDVGHFKETIQNGETGLLCRDERDFEDAILTLAANRKERIRLGRNANQSIREKFNIDKNIFKYKSILEEVVKKGQTVKFETEPV